MSEQRSPKHSSSAQDPPTRQQSSLGVMVITAVIMGALTVFGGYMIVRGLQLKQPDQSGSTQIAEANGSSADASGTAAVTENKTSNPEPKESLDEPAGDAAAEDPSLVQNVEVQERPEKKVAETASTQNQNTGTGNRPTEQTSSVNKQASSANKQGDSASSENALQQLAESEKLSLGKTVDLIALFDPAKSIQRGSWEAKNGSLISSNVEGSEVILPFKFPDNYVLRLTVKKVEEEDALSVRVRLSEHSTLMLIDGSRGKMGGLHTLDKLSAFNPKNETHFPGKMIDRGKRSEIVIYCRGKSILMTIDGKTIVDWQGDPSRLTEAEGFAPAVKKEQVMVRSFGRWEISEFTITPILDDPRVAVPTDDEIETAEKELEQNHKIDFRVVRREEKLPFAQKLRALIVAETEPASRYVLYSHALTNASEAGDLNLSLEIADEFAGEFDVSSSELKLQAISDVAKVRRDPQSYYELALVSSDLAWKASDEYRYAVAVEFLETALRLAKQSRVRTLIAQLGSNSDRFENWQTSYNSVKKSHEAIKQGSAGAADHTAWGKFLCFVIHDWEAGLPHLKQGDDQELAKLAAEEMERPKSFQPVIQLVQKWLSLASQHSASEQDAIATHARLLSMSAIPLAEDNQLPLIQQYARDLFGGATLIDTKSQSEGVLIGGASANPLAEATIEFWMLTTDTRGGCLLKREEQYFDSIGIAVDEGFAVLHTAGSFNDVDKTDVYVSDSRWHHMAVSKVGNRLKLFVDGKPVDELSLKEGFPKPNKSQWRLAFHKWSRDYQLTAYFTRIRISSISRYHTRFVPERNYKADRATMFMVE